MKAIRISGLILIILVYPLMLIAGEIISVKVDDVVFTCEKQDCHPVKCVKCDEDTVIDIQQLSCGHYACLPCAREIAKGSPPICPMKDECSDAALELLAENKCYVRDGFLTKKNREVKFTCDNCSSWTGVSSGLETHARECPNKMMPCELPECNYIAKGQEDLEKHKSDFDAHKMALIKALPQIYEILKAHNAQAPGASVIDKLEQLSLASDNSRTKQAPMPSNGMEQDSAFHRNEGITRELPYSFKTVRSDPSEQKGASQSGCHDCEALSKKLAIAERKQITMQDEIKKLEATILSKVTENEDRDFRLSLMENSNHDGTMLWKIPQFSQRREDAVTGKYTSIFSLPFYSGRYGYKMCLRLYILGDGIGKGTHMSLFFVLMKGEFDNILQWPFNHQITFKLINQCGGRDVVDTFQPDPLQAAFQQPKSDMNIASGCPRFISMHELVQNGYIIEDTVFIKVKVNTSLMKHP